jgi:Fe-S cluster assembly protein SufD
MTALTNSPSADREPFKQAYAARRLAAADEWLQPLRENAMQVFSRTGFPTTRDEDWKYTSLSDVEARSAAYLNAKQAAADIETIKQILSELPLDQCAFTVVFANGLFCGELSNLPEKDAGLTIDTLSGLGDQSKDLVRSQLGRFAQIERFQLAALNTAFLNDGLIIRLPERSDISTPIHVIFVSDQQNISVQPRVLISLGERSRASVIEHYVGQGASCTNAVSEIHLADGAHLRYTKIQQEDSLAYHLAAQYVQLDQDSRFDAVHVDLGARLARNDLTVRLAGPGASTQLDGLFVVDGQRHVDNHTRLDHLEPQTTSVENYRGIINEQGRGVFNGKIIVHTGADKSDAQLNNRNLLLSAEAEIDTKPELEIYTDDVKCAHGTTTGQLDTNALFYLRVRGIPADLAKQMLVTAFANEIINRIDSTLTPLSDYIRDGVMRQLPG